MARKNDDILGDLFDGAFWVSASIYSHGGDIGCLFAFILFAWLFLIPAFISVILNIDVDDFAPFWYGLVTPIMVFVVYRSFKKKSEEERRQAEEYENYKQALRTAYSSYTSTWILTQREKERCNIYVTAKDPAAFDKEQAAWREKLANKLVKEHIEYEKGQSIKISVDERIAAQRDIWIIYRVSQLIPQYAELTQFWVPSFDELHRVCSSIFGEHIRKYKLRSKKAFSMGYLTQPPSGNFDPFMAIMRDMVYERTERLAYQHAELEYEYGKNIPLDAIVDQAQDDESERIAYVNRSGRWVTCPYCGESQVGNDPFCRTCDATFRTKYH